MKSQNKTKKEKVSGPAAQYSSSRPPYIPASFYGNDPLLGSSSNSLDSLISPLFSPFFLHTHPPPSAMNKRHHHQSIDTQYIIYICEEGGGGKDII
jgi:hypothetical protein